MKNVFVYWNKKKWKPIRHVGVEIDGEIHLATIALTEPVKCGCCDWSRIFFLWDNDIEKKLVKHEYYYIYEGPKSIGHFLCLD